jgi:hypothetical protein
MSSNIDNQCCPRFEPAPWDEQEIRWQDKLFIKDRVTSILHIPLNFGAVMKRNMSLIESAGAASNAPVVMADENSLWGADVYIEVTRDIPGANVVRVSGTFLCKVFEGPYSNMRKWITGMKAFVQSRKKEIQKLYFFYTTCPGCAKKYGKNYVVLLAQIPDNPTQ